MKHGLILLLLFSVCFCSFELQAQVKQDSIQANQSTIIDELETLVPGDGIIQISSDPKITELVGILSPEISTSDKNYVKINGYRILVYMSNDSRTARKVIDDKRALIRDSFSEILIYRDYVAPNWKLLVGDFRTKEEAEVFKQKMLKSIPGLGKEMYIVTDKVNIPIQTD